MLERQLSAILSPPKLIAVYHRDQFVNSFIVGDEVSISLNAASLLTSVVVLLGAYYVFDLDYPQIYLQFFGLLQQLMLGESYTGSKGSHLTRFLKPIAM